MRSLIDSLLWLFYVKMLAKEIIEDSLLSFLTQEGPDFEVDDKALSQKVVSWIIVRCQIVKL